MVRLETPGLKEDREIVAALPHTWHAFFDTFGRLREVQREAIPGIMAGNDMLISSSTASGKTEAACAPLIERNYTRDGRWTILYVSPTRALVNDLYERLYTPMSILGLRLARRTGDHKDWLSPLPHVLLTTPESFDSLMCRGKTGDEYGHVLSRVVAIVLDEVHLIHGTARGEQVRWLIERLRKLRRQAKSKGWASDDIIQVIGLSATLPDFASVERQYFPYGVKKIMIRGGREIETVVPPCDDACVDIALPAYLKSVKSPEKVLVFSNKRKRVDTLAAHMRPILTLIGYQVRAHHGSLSKKVREQAEEDIKKEERVVVFSTSTLELGIDIGDIDLIVLDGPAPDISSLLQRIGRGNRRSNRTRVMACSGTLADSLIHSAMIDAARDGWLGPGRYGPCYAVTRQQIASYIFQSSRVSRQKASIMRLVNTCHPSPLPGSILDHMITNGELDEDKEGIRLGTIWKDKTVRGCIHSNIERSQGAAVIDEETGDTIALGVKYDGGQGMNVGGRLMEVRKWDSRKIEVKGIPRKNFLAGAWRYLSKSSCIDDAQAIAVRRYLEIGEDIWPIIYDNRDTYVFHLRGNACAALLWLASAGGDGEKITAVNGWYLKTPSTDKSMIDWISSLSATYLMPLIYSNIDRLESRMSRPYANRLLPTEVRVEEIVGWLNVDEELKKIRESSWEDATDISLEVALRSLI